MKSWLIKTTTFMAIHVTLASRETLILHRDLQILIVIADVSNCLVRYLNCWTITHKTGHEPGHSPTKEDAVVLLSCAELLQQRWCAELCKIRTDRTNRLWHCIIGRGFNRKPHLVNSYTHYLEKRRSISCLSI